jgi:hypothetical protein
VQCFVTASGKWEELMMRLQRQDHKYAEPELAYQERACQSTEIVIGRLEIGRIF